MNIITIIFRWGKLRHRMIELLAHHHRPQSLDLDNLCTEFSVCYIILPVIVWFLDWEMRERMKEGREHSCMGAGLHSSGFASLVVAQPRDWRKSPETAIETSMVYWTGHLRQKLPDTPLFIADGRQGTAAAFATWGKKRIPFIGGIDVRWAHSY